MAAAGRRLLSGLLNNFETQAESSVQTRACCNDQGEIPSPWLCCFFESFAKTQGEKEADAFSPSARHLYGRVSV